MLGILVKKQLMEMFKGYFYDAKKNRMRSKGAIALYILMYIMILFGCIGVMFAYFAHQICGPFCAVGVDWFYFLLISLCVIALGTLGSVFNTFAGLYLSKDNDLLFSMPIPLRTILASRLLNVYILGTIFATVAMWPAIIIYWVTDGITPAKVIGSVGLYIVVTLVILFLSCLLGWVVARISVKLKNRSFITVIVSLMAIGIYYFVYFKAQDLMTEIVSNALIFGQKVKGKAYALYIFGKAGTGDMAALAAVLAVIILLLSVVICAIARSFFKVSSAANQQTARVRYKEKRIKKKTVFGALLGKELKRFTSNATYMLNCGIATILLPFAGVFLLVKGNEFISSIAEEVEDFGEIAPVVLAAALFLMISMNYIAAPSVSLEGKSIWIPRSLPVRTRSVLFAKGLVQFILTGIPAVFAAVCAGIVLGDVLTAVLIVTVTFAFSLFTSAFDLFIGVRMPVMNWTNESTPIKQSGSVFIALFGIMVVAALFGGLYFAVGKIIGAALYFLIWSVVFTAIAALLWSWIATKGVKIFEGL